VILLLGYAHAWAPPSPLTPSEPATRCFVNFGFSQFPKWLGCAMAVHETLAGSLIAAAGALFGAWLAFSRLKDQITLLEKQIVIEQGKAKEEQHKTEILERAYVIVEPLGIEPRPCNIVGHVRCRNVGHLPARDFQISPVRMKWVHADLIENEKPIDVDTEQYKQPIPIKGGLPVGTSDLLTATDLQQVEDRQGYLLVWGKATYMDGFHPSPRFIRFCHRYPCVRRQGDQATGYKIARDISGIISTEMVRTERS
jgi:hypothetical protein